jgi:peptide/nickel transport system permease protein
MELTSHTIESEREALSVWRRISQSNAALVGLLLLGLFLFAALLADVLGPRDPMKASTETFRPPSKEFLFGTDDLGRDVFSGVIHGARTSVSIGISVALMSGFLGVLIGLVSGYSGGLVDDVLMRLTELFLVPPRFFLAIVIIAIFGSSFFTLIVVLSATFWPMTARVVRAEVMSIKRRGFVEAARAGGAGSSRIMFREILPNAMPVIVTTIALKVGAIILLEAGLEFLGLGDASHMSWGYMLHNGQHFMRDAWWMIAFPGLAVSLLVLALNLIGDELNRMLNPKLRRV